MTSLPLGQLLVFGFDGLETNQDVEQLLSHEQASGVILFARNIASLEQVVDLNRSLVQMAPQDFPTLISVDQEGGRVARLRGICTDVPNMRTIGNWSLKHPELPYRIAAMMARELIALGFHLDFAPVLDVDTNPDNPIIGDRSFSRDAGEVAEIGTRFIHGMQEAGLAACAKHFPGHGDTDKDSHLDLPIVNHDKNRIHEVELLPFRRAIDAHVASIMTAHVLLPALDHHYPATLSPFILRDLLRTQMGYEGLIVSDDLEMKAVADRYDIKELIRLGLLAGVDLFLICKDMNKMHQALRALHELVDKSEIPVERVQEALARVHTLKRRFIGAPALPEINEARTIVRSAPHLAIAQGASHDSRHPHSCC